MLYKLISCFAFLQVAQADHDIHDFGPVYERDETEWHEQANRQTFEDALTHINSTGNTDRTLWIKPGMDFSMYSTWIPDIHNVHIKIDGILRASKNYEHWTITDGQYDHFIQFENCTNVTFSGNGTVDGQGYMWWVREFLHKNEAKRPKLLRFVNHKGAEVSGLMFKNSPSFHIQGEQSEDMSFHDMEIYVDVMGQLDLHKLFGTIPVSINDPRDLIQMIEQVADENGHEIMIPMFPLNTDGIDLQGRNFTLNNIKITNFDDSIVAKPTNKADKFNCTTDLHAENITVVFGVGMSIGSVSPAVNHSCVRDFTFKNINFQYPLKAIYIKTNPGVQGTGEITNILYENIVMETPIWWGIYIGPQQMKEPSGEGPGCMLYPFGGCETDPLVSISNITLRNVTSKGGLLPAGVVRCNVSNPCTNFTFDNVDIRSEFWDTLGKGFITEYIEGTVINSFPDPGFSPNGYYASIPLEEREDEVFHIENEMTQLKFMEMALRLGFWFNDKINEPNELIQ